LALGLTPPWFISNIEIQVSGKGIQGQIDIYIDFGVGFREFKNKKYASGFLAYWCDLVDESGIKPFKKAARTIMAHWSGIVNYAKSKINNGGLEGINSKIQLA
jgi:transposase